MPVAVVLEELEILWPLPRFLRLLPLPAQASSSLNRAQRTPALHPCRAPAQVPLTVGQ